jgi:hypothetical protein
LYVLLVGNLQPTQVPLELAFSLLELVLQLLYCLSILLRQPPAHDHSHYPLVKQVAKNKQEPAVVENHSGRSPHPAGRPTLYQLHNAGDGIECGSPMLPPSAEWTHIC